MSPAVIHPADAVRCVSPPMIASLAEGFVGIEKSVRTDATPAARWTGVDAIGARRRHRSPLPNASGRSILDIDVFFKPHNAVAKLVEVGVVVGPDVLKRPDPRKCLVDAAVVRRAGEIEFATGLR